MKKKLSTLFLVGMLGLGSIFPVLAKAGDFPKSYPFSFWSESRADNDKAVVTGRFEQGVNLTEYHGWQLVPFVAMGASYDSKKSEYWNNEIVPEVGIKVTHSLKLTKGGWGNISFGVRQRWEDYFDSPVPNISRTEVFMQLGFGGDWKK